MRQSLVFFSPALSNSGNSTRAVTNSRLLIAGITFSCFFHKVLVFFVCPNADAFLSEDGTNPGRGEGNLKGKLSTFATNTCQLV